MIDKVFFPYDRDGIKQIPIGNVKDEDIIMWMVVADGNYTVKYGYHWFNTLLTTNNPDTSNYKDKEKVWKKFWSIKT